MLAPYQHLREIGRGHTSAAVQLLSPDAVLNQARRLHLRVGHMLLLDDVDVMALLLDLAIYTAELGRSRGMDRYARSARIVPGSDEALVLDTLRGARSPVVRVELPHETGGWIVEDMLRGLKLWVIDDRAKSLFVQESVIAARLYTPARCSIPAGPLVKLHPAFLEEPTCEVPQLRRKSLDEVADDRRFAQALYRLAIEAKFEHVFFDLIA